MDSRRTLEYSDADVPYHDPYAMELVVKIIAYVQPARIIENGDMGDFYEVSQFDKDPAQIRNGGLQDQTRQLSEFHCEVTRAKPADCIVDYTQGNHEFRLTRYLWRHSELFGLKALELPALLELDRFGINYYPDEIALANGNLIVKHGSIVRKAGGMSALAELENEKYAVSTLTGHTHRIGSTMVRTRRALIGGWEGGCLCDLKPAYVRNPNWQHGCTLITESIDGDSFSVAQIPFLGEGRSLKAVVEGRTVRL